MIVSTSDNSIRRNIVRSRDIIRHNKYKTIARKKRIIHSQNDYWHFKYENELSKGKIHCSCPLCRHKSYDRAKIQDVRLGRTMIGRVQDISTDTEGIAIDFSTHLSGALENRLKRSIRH